MSQAIERHQGAVRFTRPKPNQSTPSGAVIFTKSDLDCVDEDWDTIIIAVREFAELKEDWDGNHSVPPDADLIFMAVKLACQLKEFSNPAPSRVIAGVNGSISFEFGGDIFTEIEVVTPFEAAVYEDGKLVQRLLADEGH